MQISKEKLKLMLEYAFRSGISYGYGVNHEDITNEENKCWEEFWESFIKKL